MKLPLVNAAALALLCPLVSGQGSKLLASDGAEGDKFGFSVAISGGTAIVGAPHDNDNGNNSGSAYLFSECVRANYCTTSPNTAASRKLMGTLRSSFRCFRPLKSVTRAITKPTRKA